jgi:hypothetical protein
MKIIQTENFKKIASDFKTTLYDPALLYGPVSTSPVDMSKQDFIKNWNKNSNLKKRNRRRLRKFKKN